METLHSSDNWNILLLSPNSDFVNRIKDYLSDFFPNSSLRVIPEGKNSIASAFAINPDILIIDTLFNNKNGYDICKKYKNNNIFADTPIIVILPNQNDSDSITKALKAGADTYLPKPINKFDFFAAIRICGKLKRVKTQVFDSGKKENESNPPIVDNYSKNEEFYRTIFDFSHDWEYWKNPDGQLLYCSPGCERITGYTPENFFNNSNLLFEIIHPEDLDDFTSKTQNSNNEKDYITDLELRIIAKSGEIHWINYVGIFVYDHIGTLLGIRVHVHDITKRKRAEEELNNEKIFTNAILDSAPGLLYLYSDDGRLLRWNQRHKEITGYSDTELVNMKLLDWYKGDEKSQKAVLDGVNRTMTEGYGEAVADLQKKDGSPITMFFTARKLVIKNQLYFVGIGIDLTELKKIEKNQNLAIEVMQMLNESKNIYDTITHIVDKIKADLSYDAVGIRLLSNGDYPYYYQAGFSEEFIEKENSLITSNKNNSLLSERTSKPLLECNCGLVLSGKIPNENPNYTASGSFWSNGLSVLLNLPQEQDPHFHARNYCIHAGYESMALIPLKIGTEIAGLLQINDRRKDLFSEEIIKFLEGFTSNIGLALHRKQFEEALKNSEEKYRIIAENTADSISLLDLDLNFKYTSSSIYKLLGYKPEELINQNIKKIITQDSLEIVYNLFETEMKLEVEEKSSSNRIRSFETQQIKKDGSIIWVETTTTFLRDKKGAIIDFLCISKDITERKQAEEALRKSEIEFRTIFNSTSEAIFIHNALDGKIIDINDRTMEMYGYDNKEEMLKLNINNVSLGTEPYTEKHAFELIHKAKNDQIKPFEWHSKRKNGELFWSEISLKKATIGNNEYVLAVVRDITERKQTEKELYLNSERTKTLLVLNQMTNSAFKEITDFALEEGVRLTDSAIGYLALMNEDETVLTMHSWSKNAMKMCEITEKPVDYVVAETGLWGEAVRQRKAVIINDYSAPNVLKKGYPDGHITINRHMNVPIFSESRIVLLAGVGNKADPYNESDVQQLTLIMDGLWRLIERKKSEDSLRKLSLAVEQSPSTVIITDTNCIIEYVNPKFTQITGYTPKEAIGQKTSILKSDKTDNKLYEELWKQISIGNNWNGEICNKRKDGTLFWESVSISPIRDSSGKTTHYLAVKEDITSNKFAEAEKERLQEQLLQAQKIESIGRLAGGVAHDFNNMLGVIFGHTELSLKVLQKDDPVYIHLEQIHKAAQRSANLTRQLLSFARKQTITPKVLDLNFTISDMIKMLQRIIGEQINLMWLPGEQLWKVKLDPSQIDQILANLCINARDAISGIGVVTIETANITVDNSYSYKHVDAAPGQYVMITVSDTGSGMDKDVMEHLFEPFYTTKKIGEGTGLGLATIYGVVKQNQGFINVYSEVGKGTTFRIYLPRYIEESLFPENEPQQENPSLGSETILLVEDEPLILELSKSILENLNYTVLSTTSPLEAIKIADKYKKKIDLLITDVIMPEMNGKNLSEKIASIKPGIKLLFMSGYTANIIAHHGILNEDMNFIQKPFSIDGFSLKIREVLDHN